MQLLLFLSQIQVPTQNVKCNIKVNDASVVSQCRLITPYTNVTKYVEIASRRQRYKRRLEKL